MTGYSVSFGIFQKCYSDPMHGIDASPGAIATVGSMQMGIMYLMIPVIFMILNKYPHLWRWCGPVGLLITMASLSASAFVSSIVGLIATQGALYSIGCGLLFSPISLHMDEWFIQRKRLAYGIMWSGKPSVGVARGGHQEGGLWGFQTSEAIREREKARMDVFIGGKADYLKEAQKNLSWRRK
ncbi:hypothetical protein V8C34DRAFT_296921 [Trichoderma compactum]